MGTSEPLLIARDRGEGPFHRWLEILGLRDFVRRYPLSKLIAWGWIVPQATIRFPDEFFLGWKDFPYGTDEKHAAEYRVFHLLWDSEWWIDSEDEPDWFLHPLFRADDEAGRLLR